MLEGRLVKAKGGFYFVQDFKGNLMRCRARGRMKEEGKSLMVGDLVRVEAKGAAEGVIAQIYPRQRVLSRPPVANLDQVIVLMSLHFPALDLVLLDRILVSVEAAGADIIICFNKMDLVHGRQRTEARETATVFEDCGYRVILTSAVTGQGVNTLKNMLQDKINVVAGPSGVGKSTLINQIKPGLALLAAPVSQKARRGRHTTTHVELLSLDSSTFLADTPGFQRLHFTDISRRELAHFFPEMLPFLGSCRFADCLHKAEPHCAVKNAVQMGKIAPWRYEHYLAFLEEIQEKEENIK